jgi:hypothetical protein
MSELWDVTRIIRVMGPPPGSIPTQEVIECAEILGAALSEAEENISDLLPEGWYVKIEEVTPNE